MKDWVSGLAARSFPKGPRSQGGQDGILAEIFRNVGNVNSPPYCVEFGFNGSSFEDGTGANVATLVLDYGWHALLFDGGNENPAINLRREFLTSANIVDVFVKWGVPAEPDYVSIDLDSTDLWIFRALLPRYRAAVYSVEYNCHFPIDAAITFPDDPAERWQSDRGYGASLKALVMVAEEFGYSLVAVDPILDAFFVRNDLLDDGSGVLAPPLALWRRHTSLAFGHPLFEPRRAGIFVDYEVWRDTGGDVELARRAGLPVAQRYLTRGLWRYRARVAKRQISRFRDRVLSGIKRRAKKLLIALGAAAYEQP